LQLQECMLRYLL